jgi:hypothetical protein
MAADGHDAAFVAAKETAGEGDVEHHAHAVGAPRVLGDAHGPDEHAGAGPADEVGEVLDALAGQAGGGGEVIPIELGGAGGELVPPRGVPGEEAAIHLVGGDEVLEHAVEEGDVAALRDRVPLVGEIGAEERAVDVGGHPVTLHARFEVGVHEDDLGALLFGEVQVFGGNGLVVGGIGAEKYDDIAAKPVGVAAGGGGDAEGLFHRRGGGRMAEAGGVINVVGAKPAGGLLGEVIDLVGDAARGDEEGEAARVGRAQARPDAGEGVVPGDAGEARLAVTPPQRMGEPAEDAQLPVVAAPPGADVDEGVFRHGRHGVEPQQIQPRHAEVGALDGPVVETGYAERAAVAHAAGDYLPGVGQVVAVVPHDLEHVAEVFGLGVTEAKRGQAGEALAKRLGGQAHGGRMGAEATGGVKW